MSEAARNPLRLSKWPALPLHATTHDGYPFNPAAPVWRIDTLECRTIYLRFDQLSVFSADLVHRLKLTLLDFAEKQSLSHLRNMSERVFEFYRALFSEGTQEVDAIGIDHLLNFRAQLNDRTVWKLGAIRVAFERGQSLGYSLLTGEAAAYFGDAVIAGNPKGVDVRTRDSRKGAFSTIELETVNSALNAAYTRGDVDLQDYALCHFILAYGTRSIQIASLKDGDLLKHGDIYTLRIPRAKQQGHLRRETFKMRACDKRLGELLEWHLSEIKWPPDAPERGDRPMFPASQPGSVPGFAYHMAGREIGKRITVIFEAVARYQSNPKRFRHTLAKRAHDDGATVYVIAELLDHSDIQNAKVYTEGGPDIVERLNRTMALQLAPIAQAFAEKLVRSGDPDAQAGGAAKRIHDRALPEGKGNAALGTCGLNSFCSLARPIACYTCISFRPWDDGPHEEVLDKLLQERERQREKGYAPRIYGLHDRTIAAVARVVQLCSERQADGEAE